MSSTLTRANLSSPSTSSTEPKIDEAHPIMKEAFQVYKNRHGLDHVNSELSSLQNSSNTNERSHKIRRDLQKNNDTPHVDRKSFIDKTLDSVLIITPLLAVGYILCTQLSVLYKIICIILLAISVLFYTFQTLNINVWKFMK